MKYLHLFIGLLFIAFALVQINDPDPYLWVLVYLGVALCAIAHFFERPLKWIALIGLVGCLVGAVLITPEFIGWLEDGMPSIVTSMKAETPYIELVREFLGYIIAGIAYGVYFAKSRAIKSQ